MASAWLPFREKIPLEQVALFCGNLATCLRAGLNIPASLRASTRSAPNAALREIIERAAEQAAAGQGLADALEPWQHRFPAFFLPVLRCGEKSGRIDEAAAYLERHCRLLAGPARVMRNTWLVPLGIMLCGSLISMVACLFLAPFRATLAYVADTAMFYGIVAVVAAIVLYVPDAKRILDELKLVLPLIGQAERELAMNRFFHAMNMLYSTSGQRVEQMIRLAAESADNLALRNDFLRAAVVIEKGGTIAEAFMAPATISGDLKGILLAGDHAGKLETALDTVARLTAESAQFRLRAFQQFFFRAVTAAVVFSMATTIWSLVMMRG